MLNQEVDDLIKALVGLRLRRETTLRLLGNINLQESEILEDLVVARAALVSASAEPEIVADTNLHAIGDVLTIGNNIQDEFWIRGVVISSGIRPVTIRNTTTGKTYTRAWWNLNLTGAGTPAERI